jgi:hypothetical protein
LLLVLPTFRIFDGVGYVLRQQRLHAEEARQTACLAAVSGRRRGVLHVRGVVDADKDGDDVAYLCRALILEECARA